jgi:hypothetical protein
MGPGVMDAVTILQTKGSLAAAKRIWQREGEEPRIKDYDNPKHFAVHERPVGSLGDLAELLTKIEKQCHYLIIRGRPLDGIDRQNAVRRMHANGAEAACFAEEARWWIPLDFDAIPCPGGFDPINDPEAAVRYLAGLLPEPFHGTSCWWQHTSGAGVKPGIRMRLFYWGSRAVSDDELKTWLAEAPIDNSIYNPVQAIYVANPIIETGADPVRMRSGIFGGSRDVVEVPAEIEPPRPAAKGPIGYAGWCARIGDHDGGQGFNGPIGSAIAAWVAKNGADHDPRWLRADIEKIIRRANASRHSSAEIENRISQLDDRIKWTREREAQKPSRHSQSAEAAAIAADAQLFHTPADDAFADIEVRGHRESYLVRSKAFKQWLSFGYYTKHGKPPSSDALEQALILSEGKARYQAPEMEAHVRIARVGDALYVDLADSEWRAVEVTKTGWRVIDRPPVRFRRTAGMLPLPVPQEGGDVNALKDFLNIDDDGFLLAVAWQLAALGGIGPYPILCLYGEHGAAKTSGGRYCRRCIDPNVLLSRGPPRSDRDLYVAAHNSHVLHFENISKMPEWLSDTLCRLATGGGFATRELYENADEVMFRGMRPLILDGIDNFVERPDLADRSIKLTLQAVTEENRRGEKDMLKAFDEKHPVILGALLDAVAYGLGELPATHLATLPRMADFALWIAACEGALWSKGEFQRIYDANRESMLIDTVESDIVAAVVADFVRSREWQYDDKKRDQEYWVGTAEELLFSLTSRADLKTTLNHMWPKNARALSARLRRIKKGMLAVGVDVQVGDGHARTIQLWPAAGAQTTQETQNARTCLFDSPPY